MTFYHVLSDLEFEIIQGGNVPVAGIAKDAVKVQSGYVYVCIQGISGDGHNYINDAVANGAVAVVTDKKLQSYPSGVSVVQVRDSRAALGFMCRSFHCDPLKGVRVFAVTGTNGKTSTTYFMEGILREGNKVCGTIGTSGVKVNGVEIDMRFATSTTPDPIELFAIFAAFRSRGVTDVVMEASSHALALGKLDAVSFDYSIFTNLTQDHIDFHKNLENYFMAKAKLFSLTKTGILNADDEASTRIKAMYGSSCRWFEYGVERDCAFKAENIRYSIGGSVFELMLNNKKERFSLAIPGGYSVCNALGAITAAHAAGIKTDVIRRGMASVTEIPGRIQSVPNALGIGVIVDYAHTPDGLQKVISAVRAFTEGRVITMFGCGGDRDRAKRPIMGKIAGEESDLCVITSDNPRNENPADIIADVLPGMLESGGEFITEPDRRRAIFEAIRAAKPGDTVILAGKGHEDYQELENKRKIPFDDRIIAAETLRELEKRI